MLELLFLLLPIAVMYGWYMGVRQAKLSSDESKTSQTQQFVSGVKFLLEEKKDRASDIFVDLLHINSDNFDANLALAEVYRVRGDADKAIRIHNSHSSTKNCCIACMCSTPMLLPMRECCSRHCWLRF